MTSATNLKLQSEMSEMHSFLQDVMGAIPSHVIVLDSSRAVINCNRDLTVAFAIEKENFGADIETGHTCAWTRHNAAVLCLPHAVVSVVRGTASWHGIARSVVAVEWLSSQSEPGLLQATLSSSHVSNGATPHMSRPGSQATSRRDSQVSNESSMAQLEPKAMLFKDCELLCGDGHKLHVDVTIRDFREGVSPPATHSQARLRRGCRSAVRQLRWVPCCGLELASRGREARGYHCLARGAPHHARTPEQHRAHGQRRSLDRTFAVLKR